MKFVLINTSLSMIAYKNMVNMISYYINIWCIVFSSDKSTLISLSKYQYVTTPVGQSALGD